MGSGFEKPTVWLASPKTEHHTKNGVALIIIVGLLFLV